MVTQAPGGTSILQNPIQQIFQQLGQSSLLQASIATVAQVNASSVQSTSERLQSQEAPLQQPTVLQQRGVEGNHLENSANATVLQQPSRSQQQVTANTMLNHQANSTEKSQYTNLQTAVFTSKSSEVDSATEPVANSSFSITQSMQDQLSTEPQDSMQQQVSDDIIEMIILDNGLDDNALLKEQDSISITEEVGPSLFKNLL